MIDYRSAARAIAGRLPQEETSLRIGIIGGIIGIGATFFPWLIGVPEDPLVLFRLAAGCVCSVGLGISLGVKWSGRPGGKTPMPPTSQATAPRVEP